MKNPKVRIESDGKRTELYINEKLVDKATLADFHFHAEPHIATLEYDYYVTDENGRYVIENDDAVIKTVDFKFGEAVEE